MCGTVLEARGRRAKRGGTQGYMRVMFRGVSEARGRRGDSGGVFNDVCKMSEMPHYKSG